MELNFIEAVDNAFYAYTDRDFPFEVEGIIERYTARAKGEGGVEGGDGSDAFASCCVALGKFVNSPENPRRLPPLNGSIPDMTASTQGFIRVQEIYQTQAKKDLGRMRSLLDDSGSNSIVTDDYLKTFCQNAYNLREVSSRSFKAEMEMDTSTIDAGADMGDIKDDLMMSIMSLGETGDEATEDCR